MSSHGYSEDDLVKQPALDLFRELGWETVDAFGEFGRAGGDGRSGLGRETEGEVVLVARLRPALERLNPNAGEAAVDQAIEELTRDRSRMSPAAANRETYRLLKDGVRVNVPSFEENGDTVERVQVIDWNVPANNDFLLCSEFWLAGEMYRRRADLVGFVNGLPLLFCEVEGVHRRLEDAYNENLRDYKDTIPQLFWFNCLACARTHRAGPDGRESSSALNAAEFFRQVVEFTQDLNEEERRGVAEKLDPDELAVFDILTRPRVEMSDADCKKVKATARELLATLKAGKFALDWRTKQQARAAVRVTIEEHLDAGLPRAYTPVLFQKSEQ